MPGIEREWVALEINELLVVEVLQPQGSDPRDLFHSAPSCLLLHHPAFGGVFDGKEGCCQQAEMGSPVPALVLNPRCADALGDCWSRP